MIWTTFLLINGDITIKNDATDVILTSPRLRGISKICFHIVILFLPYVVLNMIPVKISGQNFTSMIIPVTSRKVVYGLFKYHKFN